MSKSYYSIITQNHIQIITNKINTEYLEETST